MEFITIEIVCCHSRPFSVSIASRNGMQPHRRNPFLFVTTGWVKIHGHIWFFNRIFNILCNFSKHWQYNLYNMEIFWHKNIWDRPQFTKMAEVWTQDSILGMMCALQPLHGPTDYPNTQNVVWHHNVHYMNTNHGYFLFNLLFKPLKSVNAALLNPAL